MSKDYAHHLVAATQRFFSKQNSVPPADHLVPALRRSCHRRGVETYARQMLFATLLSFLGVDWTPFDSRYSTVFRRRSVVLYAQHLVVAMRRSC